MEKLNMSFANRISQQFSRMNNVNNYNQQVQNADIPQANSNSVFGRTLSRMTSGTPQNNPNQTINRVLGGFQQTNTDNSFASNLNPMMSSATGQPVQSYQQHQTQSFSGNPFFNGFRRNVWTKDDLLSTVGNMFQ